MLFAIILGVLLIVMGLFSIVCEAPKAKQNKLMVMGIVLILCGVVANIHAIININQGWILEKQSVLDLVSEDSYLIENEGSYIYKDRYPSDKKGLQIVEENEEIEVKVQSVKKEEMALLLVIRKVEWIGVKRQYVFYIPTDDIDKD